MSTAQVKDVFQQIQTDPKEGVSTLFALLHEELRRHAQYLMSNERRNHTLQPTALVNEAFLKLAGRQSLTWENRRHFYNAAADAMRKILVDHARRRNARKRGGEISLLSLAEPEAPDDDDRQVDIEQLDAALAKLQKFDQRRYQVVMYRYFAGLEEAQIAQLLKVSLKTVQRDWQTARVFLLAEIKKARA